MDVSLYSFSTKNLFAYSLNQSFVAESKSRDVVVLPVDFANTNDALYTINNWISSATKNHIRNLFKPDHLYGLRLLLTNTMYFKGLWRTIFNETVYDKFETTEKLHKGVTFMKKVEKLRGSEFVTTNGVKATWVEVPYEVRKLMFEKLQTTVSSIIRRRGKFNGKHRLPLLNQILQIQFLNSTNLSLSIWTGS